MVDVRAIAQTRLQNPFGSAGNPILTNPRSPHLQVRFGQKTFDAEGCESLGRYFSRSITWPGGSGSGVTIGRGYDMGVRGQHQVARELALVGVSRQDAEILSQGAGLRGNAAAVFIRNNQESFPILSLEAQRRLFEEVTTPETVNDIKRIFAKSDTVATYGAVSWDTMPSAAQEIVFDLRYRGDYTPTTRKRIQPILASQEWHKLPELMNDTVYWNGLGVPRERIAKRASIVAELQTAAS